MFSMTKIGRFLRRFSVVDFKDSKPKISVTFTSNFHWKSNAFLWFDFQLKVLLITEEEMHRRNVQLL